MNITHLMGHSALNMHYVNGVPANRKMPPIKDFLNGNAEFGYVPVKVINTPGEVFQYSGAGFIVLEHLIEAMENKSIVNLTRPYLDQLGMKEFSFEQQDQKNITYVHGLNDKGQEVEGTRKMFPAFAAGAMGTASSMAEFLKHLEEAYHNLTGSGSISHDTAVQMLLGSDKGCQRFMGCKMGLGIFIAEAGLNKMAIHQGANDGFRCIYLHCFAGPDRGKGLVALCNSDLSGVLFNAEVTQIILRAFQMQGVDLSKFKANFKTEHLSQEEIVNIGYKSLVFNAFIPTRPEPIIDKGPIDPLAIYNTLVGSKVLEVTDELFAQADNLISDHLPKFDPELFGKQGKVMDSWETVRHNQKGEDYLILEMKASARFNYILLSTKYHSGNYSPVVKFEGQSSVSQNWIEFLPKTNLAGHSEKRIKLTKATEAFARIKVTMYPDGGFTRLGLYENLPEEVAKTFQMIEEAKNIPYEEKIPQTNKPLSIKYNPDENEIKKNFHSIVAGSEFNNASLALGARIIKATDEHYSPAVLVLSPFAPINMFDGMESARSRIPGHFEEIILALANKTKIHRIEMEFTFFVNNNPLEVDVEGLSMGEWIVLIKKTNVKAYAGNQIAFQIKDERIYEQLRVRTFPDGGMNRFRAFSFKN